MELQIWIYYLLTILILTATPGPNIFLSLSTSISKGFTSSLYVVFGGLSATLIIMTLSFTGLGMIIASSQILFDIIKYSGSLYLIYLGYQALTSKQEDYTLDIKNQNNINKISLFVKGFIVGSSNPKAIVFFIALFPQFIDINGSMYIQYFIFVTTFIIPELFWLLLYAYLGKKSSVWFLTHGRAKFFNKITGGVFVGAGAILSTSSRT